MGDITTNFSVSELATVNGEFNMDLRQLLAMQACRSWMDVAWHFADGGGCRAKPSASSHSIQAPPDLKIIPATGADPYTNEYDTWEFMEQVEFINDNVLNTIHIGANDGGWEENITMIDEGKLFFSGRGCYPDTNNQCIHLDMAHLSLNPETLKKRTNPDGSIKVVRWYRWKGVYYYGDSFAELKADWEARR